LIYLRFWIFAKVEILSSNLPDACEALVQKAISKQNAHQDNLTVLTLALGIPFLFKEIV
jgi:serine/threonine protein phosphatase PrpC